MSDHAADDTVPEVDESRRKFLIAATAGTGAIGAVLTAVPFSLPGVPPRAPAPRVCLPKWTCARSSRARWPPSSGASSRSTWSGARRRWSLRSSRTTTVEGPESQESDQPAYAKNEDRPLKPDVLVLIGTCTHLGCLPKTRFTPGDATVMATGQAASSAPATARSSTSRAACSRVRRRR